MGNIEQYKEMVNKYLVCCIEFLRKYDTQIILILSFILAALFILAFCQEDDGGWLARLFGVERKSEVIQVLGTITLRLIAVIGILVAIRRIEVAKKRTEVENRQAEITNEAGREKRFNDGLEHLGSKKFSVRQGGIYGLYQLAQDYSKIDDKKERGDNIINILHAYIRETTNSEKYQDKHKKLPSGDIQSMLDLLFKKAGGKDPLRGTNEEINLSRSWLRGANLNRANLQGANLQYAQLQRANLQNTQLQGASLQKAQLQEARLFSAQLQMAALQYAQLQHAYIHRAQLQMANLQYAQLQEASLMNAQLQGADLDGVKLQAANLMDAQLQGANLQYAELQMANLQNAQLQAANLMNAQLQGADLQYAKLQGANLDKTRLQGTGEQSWLYDYTSEDRTLEGHIQSRVGCQSDLENSTFSGGIKSMQIEEVTNVLNNQIKTIEQSHLPKHFRKIELALLRHSLAKIAKTMKQHLDKPASNKPPSEAITGIYSQAEANCWLKELKEATDPKNWGNESDQN